MMRVFPPLPLVKVGEQTMEKKTVAVAKGRHLDCKPADQQDGTSDAGATNFQMDFTDVEGHFYLLF